MLEVSVIIVNFNTKNLTSNCLDSIIKYTADISFEIILVDNASSDGSQEYFRTRKDIVFIESNENVGFGRANNLGVKNAIGDFLFFLNSDTLLLENSIKILHNFYLEKSKDLKIGVLGCVLVDANLEITNSGGVFPTPLNDVKLYYNALVSKITGQVESLKNSSFVGSYCKIDMVSGADMFMLKDLFLKVEGFDKNFFLYYEETDLQKRLFTLGFQNFLINTSKIIHLEGGSFGTISNFKRIIIQESRNRYFRKHHNFGYFVYVIIDMFVNCTRLFNRRYRYSENKEYIIKNIKSYF